MAADEEIQRIVIALGGHLGAVIRDDRRRARWPIRRLAKAAGVSYSLAQWVEAGHPGSVETYARLANALGRRLEIGLIDPRRAKPRRDEDPVHAAMGEVLAARLGSRGFDLSLDEPYQRFQFAGRADLVAWSVERRALLHIENRTRLPNFQDAVGAYNAKRRWLAPSLAEKLAIRGGFLTATHVLVGLWSAEMLHAARLRGASLRAICPNALDPLDGWLAGDPPRVGTSSSFALFDPIQVGRADRRQIIDLATTLRPTTRPRYRGYADALDALRKAGLA